MSDQEIDSTQAYWESIFGKGSKPTPEQSARTRAILAGEKVPKLEPKITQLGPATPPEEPPAEPDLLSPEQLAEKKRQEREEAFERYKASRPDLYPPED